MSTTSKFYKSSLGSFGSFEEDFFYDKKTFIHRSSIIGPKVEIGDNVKIGPFCVLSGQIKIDSGTRIYSNVSIGSPAQNLETKESLGKIEIGKNCTIREFATIGASKYPAGKTIIGDGCYIMSYSHVAHDVILENNVTLINNVNLGGHVYVGESAFLMANSAAHQFCRIGKFCSLAPYSAIRQDIPPFCMFSGLPAKFYGLNSVALKRAGMNKETINAIKHVAKLFYQNKLLLNEIETLSAKQSEESWGKNFRVREFIEFVKQSDRGVSRKTSIEGP